VKIESGLTSKISYFHMISPESKPMLMPMTTTPKNICP